MILIYTCRKELFVRSERTPSVPSLHSQPIKFDYKIIKFSKSELFFFYYRNTASTTTSISHNKSSASKTISKSPRAKLRIPPASPKTQSVRGMPNLLLTPGKCLIYSELYRLQIHEFQGNMKKLCIFGNLQPP